jgi:hypothetical protein
MDYSAFMDKTTDRAREYNGIREQLGMAPPPLAEQPPQEDVPAFSVEEILENKPEMIKQMTGFTSDEFVEMYNVAQPALLRPHQSGRPYHIAPIDQFFVLILWLTSGFCYRQMSFSTKLSQSCLHRIVHNCLNVLPGVFVKRFIPSPDSLNSVESNRRFESFPAAFGVVDASPIFIQRPQRHADGYYQGKYKKHCVKVQVLVTPDGLCAHLSPVCQGSAHDKRLFDESGIIKALHCVGRHHRCLPILADLGYQGILQTCQGAILPYKKLPGRELTEEQKEHNRLLAVDRVIIENYFGRWKTLFGIVHELLYRGSIRDLSPIVQLTIAMTNYYVLQHPLRREPSAVESEFEYPYDDAETGDVVFLDDLSDHSDDEEENLSVSNTSPRKERAARLRGQIERFASYSDSDSD